MLCVAISIGQQVEVELNGNSTYMKWRERERVRKKLVQEQHPCNSITKKRNKNTQIMRKTWICNEFVTIFSSISQTSERTSAKLSYMLHSFYLNLDSRSLYVTFLFEKNFRSLFFFRYFCCFCSLKFWICWMGVNCFFRIWLKLKSDTRRVSRKEIYWNV